MVVLPFVLRKETREGEDSVQKTDGYSAITYYSKDDSMPSGFDTVEVSSPVGVNSHSLLTSPECVLLPHCDKALGIKNMRSYSILTRMFHLKYVVELSLDSFESD